ncbi:23018_t:CDS:2, partial [Racocetra persica]
MDYGDDSEHFEERSLNIAVPDQHLAKALDAPIVRQMFGTWEELNQFISLYARSQNFVSVICGSEYDD